MTRRKRILGPIAPVGGRGFHPGRDRRRWFAVRDSIPMPEWMVEEIERHQAECSDCRGEIESYARLEPITAWEILTGLSMPKEGIKV